VSRFESTKYLRSNDRRPLQGAVRIAWPGASGAIMGLRGKCLDFSENGLRVECDQALDKGTHVYLDASAFGLMGNAQVRHCRRAGLKYVIGFQFSSAASLADSGRRRLIQDRAHGEN